MWAGLEDLTSTEVPCCSPHRMSTTSAILPYFWAISCRIGCCSSMLSQGLLLRAVMLRAAAVGESVHLGHLLQGGGCISMWARGCCGGEQMCFWVIFCQIGGCSSMRAQGCCGGENLDFWVIFCMIGGCSSMLAQGCCSGEHQCAGHQKELAAVGSELPWEACWAAAARIYSCSYGAGVWLVHTYTLCRAVWRVQAGCDWKPPIVSMVNNVMTAGFDMNSTMLKMPARSIPADAYCSSRAAWR